MSFPLTPAHSGRGRTAFSSSPRRSALECPPRPDHAEDGLTWLPTHAPPGTTLDLQTLTAGRFRRTNRGLGAVESLPEGERVLADPRPSRFCKSFIRSTAAALLILIRRASGPPARVGTSCHPTVHGLSGQGRDSAEPPFRAELDGGSRASLLGSASPLPTPSGTSHPRSPIAVLGRCPWS